MNPYKVVYKGDWNFSDTKACPFCGEKIKRVAIKCKHCLSILEVENKALPATQGATGQNSKNRDANFIQIYGDVKVGRDVATANNLQLIQMLFNGLLESLSAARGHIQHKNINEQSKAIARASRIVIGLQGALDFEKGGDLANDLNKLYIYITRRLLHANAHNDLTALDEIYGLILTLSDTWKEIQVPSTTENNN